MYPHANQRNDVRNANRCITLVSAKERSQQRALTENAKPQTTSINVVSTHDETTVTSPSQRSSEILLNDKGVETNILFHEGTPRFFITQKLADNLGVEPTGKVNMQLSAFGNT